MQIFSLCIQAIQNTWGERILSKKNISVTYFETVKLEIKKFKSSWLLHTKYLPVYWVIGNYRYGF